MSFNGQTLNAGQPDPNATPTTPAQPAQQPAQPMQNAQPQAQPQQPNPNQPNSAALNPNTNPVHKSLFDRIFTGLGGGPRYVTTADPQTGQPKTVEVPTSKGDISRSLLAGVIHGMISGYQAGNNTPAGPLGTRSAGIANGLAAGNAAAAANQQQFKNAPQAQYDKQQAAALTASNNVVAELRNQAMIGNLHNDQWDQGEKYYQQTQDTWGPALDTIDKTSADTGTQLIADDARHLKGPEVMQMLKGKLGQYSPIQDGWATEVHQDGRTYHVPTFALVRQGDVSVDRDAIASLAPYDKRMQAALDKTQGPITLSTQQLIAVEKNAGAAQGAYTAFNRWQKALGTDDDDLMSQAKFNEQFRTNPAFAREVTNVASAVGNIKSQSTDHALSTLMQNGQAPTFLSMLGDPDKVRDYVNEQQRKEAEKNSVSNAAGKIALQSMKSLAAPMTYGKAMSIHTDPGADPLLKSRADAFIDYKNTIDMQQAKAKQDLKNYLDTGDLDQIAQQIFTGNILLSDLPKRQMTAEKLTAITARAKQMAIANGFPDWNPDVAMQWAKEATNPQNQTFMGSANSLINPGGTLDIFKERFDKLGQVQIPILNEWKDYLQYNFGDSDIQPVYAAAVGVADDYGKVMAGSAGTDSARQAGLISLQQLTAFKNAASPAAMEKILDTMRANVRSQVDGRIGHNPYMQVQYGQNVPANAKNASLPQVHAGSTGAVPAASKQTGTQTTQAPAMPAGAVSQQADASGNVYWLNAAGKIIGRKQ